MKKKSIGITLTIIIAISILAGCGEHAEEKRKEKVQTPELETAPDSGIQENSTEENGQAVSESLEDIYADDEEKEHAPEELQQNSLEYLNDETVPEVYREVLKQYREMIQANITDINSGSVQEKLYGEWKYVWDELYAVTHHGEICYSLIDLTGDGFPEMIMGLHDFPEYQSVLPEYSPYVVYYYSENEGIEMVCPKTTWYDPLVFYEEGIVELSRDDRYRSFTQFQKESQSWITVMELGIEYDDKSWEPIGYYKEEYNGEPERNHEIISEEEYFDIVEKYTAHPIELEWIDLEV